MFSVRSQILVNMDSPASSVFRGSSQSFQAESESVLPGFSRGSRREPGAEREPGGRRSERKPGRTRSEPGPSSCGFLVCHVGGRASSYCSSGHGPAPCAVRTDDLPKGRLNSVHGHFCLLDVAMNRHQSYRSVHGCRGVVESHRDSFRRAKRS